MGDKDGKWTNCLVNRYERSAKNTQRNDGANCYLLNPLHRTSPDCRWATVLRQQDIEIHPVNTTTHKLISQPHLGAIRFVRSRKTGKWGKVIFRDDRKDGDLVTTDDFDRRVISDDLQRGYLRVKIPFGRRGSQLLNVSDIDAFRYHWPGDDNWRPQERPRVP